MKTKVLCIGSSSTANVINGVIYYPHLLNNHSEITAINGGVIGLSYESALEYAHATIPLVKPNIVTILLGLNEIKEGCPFGVIMLHVKRLVNYIRENSATPIIGSLLYMCEDAHKKFIVCRPYIQEFNRLLSEFAKDNNVKFVDNYQNTINDELFLSDKYHPNSRGHEIIAKNFLFAIEKHINN